VKHKVNRIHFIGISGSGMNGIAEVLLNLGYRVTGSDLAETKTVARLRKAGALIWIGHDADHVEGCDVVVVSAAIKPDNTELMAAKEKKIPVVPRALMLAELMRLRRGIAVAGSHGKTTTTSLIASVLAIGQLDPTFVIGGRLNAVEANAKLGSGDLIVVEADESDASFLHLNPQIAVVTNIDADHLETYRYDFEVLKETFVTFLNRLPFYGLGVLCIDDANIASIIDELSKPVMTYGLSAAATVRAVDVVADGSKMRFSVIRPKRPRLDVVLNLPGLHNVRNALAAVCVATELNVADEAIIIGLSEFRGVRRRFQQYGPLRLADGRSFDIVDDYGHHPTEIAATITAARGVYPDRRIVLAFQPHRYSRTRDLFEDFVTVLSEADALILTEVYPAGEAPIVAADGRALARAIRVYGRIEPVFVETAAEIVDRLNDMIVDGDLVVMMGAGDIGKIAKPLATELGGKR
jgi:UDP-N-acetylmuramate--alanine ligase